MERAQVSSKFDFAVELQLESHLLLKPANFPIQLPDVLHPGNAVRQFLAASERMWEEGTQQLCVEALDVERLR